MRRGSRGDVRTKNIALNLALEEVDAPGWEDAAEKVDTATLPEDVEY